MSRWARIVIGVVLVWGALGVVGYQMGWKLHLRHAQSTLLGRAADGTCPPGAAAPPARQGQLTGVLDIPSLQVTAPVAEGTSDAVLAVAVGHASSTPMPGAPGTAVLLAHDVSYFAGIAALRPGDVVRYRSGCTTAVFAVTGHDVVRAGDPVPPQRGDGLVLDTCWPTDALWYTPRRYLVEAVQTSTVTARSATAPNTRTFPVDYAAPAPPALGAQGLDLAHNPAPMGTMRLAPTIERAWAQSPAPLAVEHAALATYFGALRAAGQRHSDWWRALAPGVPLSGQRAAALSGGRVVTYDAPLQVTVTGTGTTPRTVTLDSALTLTGDAAPGRYHEHVVEAVRGRSLVVTSWEVDHG